mmetsp:Transcript_16516/g.49025  ORF Transcript_16516/g.49025 Transcript_16516/m.49025 type:complete len:139 (-) Transcript_16516:43-459(-)
MLARPHRVSPEKVFRSGAEIVTGGEMRRACKGVQHLVCDEISTRFLIRVVFTEIIVPALASSPPPVELEHLKDERHVGERRRERGCLGADWSLGGARELRSLHAVYAATRLGGGCAGSAVGTCGVSGCKDAPAELIAE